MFLMLLPNTNTKDNSRPDTVTHVLVRLTCTGMHTVSDKVFTTGVCEPHHKEALLLQMHEPFLTCW